MTREVSDPTQHALCPVLNETDWCESPTCIICQAW